MVIPHIMRLKLPSAPLTDAGTYYFRNRLIHHMRTLKGEEPSRVVKNGSVVSILRVLTKRGGDDEKTGGVSTEIR
jgi:hypothetical protein